MIDGTIVWSVKMDFDCWECVIDWLMQEEFEDHAELAKTLPDNTTNESKLILYGLYKQATVGPVNTSEYIPLPITYSSCNYSVLLLSCFGRHA